MLTLSNTIAQSVPQVLHDLGMDLHTLDKHGRTAAMLAAYFGHVESVKWLHDMKVDLNMQDTKGKTAIHLAAINGETEMLKVTSRQ